MQLRYLLVAGLVLAACESGTDPMLLKCDTYYEELDTEQTDYWIVDWEGETITSETEGSIYKITHFDEYRIVGEMQLTNDAAFRVQLDRRTLDLSLVLDMKGGTGSATKYTCEIASAKKISFD